MILLRRLFIAIGFLTMLVSSVEVSAQDLIVTISGDSMNVEIQKDNAQFVYYRYNKSRKGDFVISKKEVKELKYGYYAATGVYSPTEGEKAAQSNTTEEEKLDRFQLWGAYGWAFMIAEGEDGPFEDYTRDLKSGSNFSFGVSTLFNKHFGLGFIYEQANFDAKFDGNVKFTFIDEDGLPVEHFGIMSDDIRIQHYGLEAIFRFPFSKSASAFQLNAGFGFSTYYNEAYMVYKYSLEGESVAMSLGASLQIGLGGGIYIPLKVALKSVAFTDVETKYPHETTPDEFKYILESSIEEAEGMAGSRLELSIGLLWMF